MKTTKSNSLHKILRQISREEQFQRNGGGQFVAMNRKYRDKSKYDRKVSKRDLKKEISSYLFLPEINRNKSSNLINKTMKIKIKRFSSKDKRKTAYLYASGGFAGAELGNIVSDKSIKGILIGTAAGLASAGAIDAYRKRKKK